MDDTQNQPPVPGQKPPSRAQNKKLQDLALEKLARARAHKARVAQDLMEGYFFTNPRRMRDVQSWFANTQRMPSQNQAELQITVGMDCSQDFAGMVMNTFMPSNFPWVKRGKGALPDDVWQQISDQVLQNDLKILATIRGSNFDAVAYQAYEPDLSLGMAAIWIDEDEIFKAPMCRAIPLRKIEVDLGPDGTVGPRFYVDQVPGRDLEAVLGSLFDKVPKRIIDEAKNSPTKNYEVVYGFWRNYANKGTEEWQQVVLVDRNLIHDELMNGEGSMPLIITPWAPGPDSPWGDGPVLKALPYLRVLDCLSGLTQDRADIAGAPPFAYPNDGVLNFEGGIEAGKAYPMSPGSTKNDFVPLYFEGDPNLEVMTYDKVEQSIRRIWFVDRPEQAGKTPPTAAQWLDQVSELQKRIGLVGQRYWRDGPRAYFMRFKYLLEKQGKIQKIVLNGQELNNLEPYNPAIKGQEYQEVQTAARLLQMIMELGGVQGQALVNVADTFRAIKAKLGDEIVVFNDPAVLKDMMNELMPQQGMQVQDRFGSRGPPQQ